MESIKTKFKTLLLISIGILIAAFIASVTFNVAQWNQIVVRPEKFCGSDGMAGAYEAYTKNKIGEETLEEAKQRWRKNNAQ